LFSIGIFVLGAIGFAGYRVYTSQNRIDAKAENYNGVNHYFADCNPDVNKRPVLKNGSRDTTDSTCVKALQRSLNNCCGQRLSEDGVFGYATERAVKDFQGFFNSPQTGVVDAKTWSGIDFIYETAIKNARKKYVSPQAVWDEARKGPSIVGGNIGSVPKGAKAKQIISETFFDGNLASRGWQQNLTACKFTTAEKLNQKVIKCSFKAGKDEPEGGSSIVSYYQLNPGLEEFTLAFKVKADGDNNYYLERQVLHSFGALSGKNGTPANSFGTLYFDPLRDRGKDSRKDKADWGLVFQDNQAINCSYNVVQEGKVVPQPLDKKGIKDRSVGGMQQSTYDEPAVKGVVWGDPCSGGLSTYTGQSMWSFYPNAKKNPVEKGQWTDVVYYVKLNTPGKQDGKAYIAVKGIDEKEWTITHQSNNMIFRSDGKNADFKVDQLGFGPWASSNDYNFNASWTDFKLYSGDAR
jgi:peptidoglycan hydrolase-like protein with peptidoglycan-binding domain